MDAQLPAQAAYVRANSRIADAQPARDRAGGLSRGDQAQHLPLAHGQALQLAGDRLLFVQQSCDRPRRDQVPPRATARIASTTSAAARDLWMNALAPASTAAMRAASLSSRERKMSFASGKVARICAAASAPVPSGKRKSISKTSGFCSATRATD